MIEINEFRDQLNRELNILVSTFRKVGELPVKGLGGLLYVPKIIEIPDNGKTGFGCIRDSIVKSEDMPNNIVSVPMGYASVIRTIEDSKVSIPLLCFAIESMKRQRVWTPDNYHFGDFIKLSNVEELEGKTHYNVTFESTAIPLLETTYLNRIY